MACRPEFHQEIVISRENSSPLIIDVRDLEHRPGTMRRLEKVVPAPKDFGNALIGAPEGSDIELELRLESVHDGILVSGTAAVDIHGECSRCLDPIDYDLDVDVQELYLFDAATTGGEDVEDDQMYEVQDEKIDLEPMLRDAVITQLPFQPVCREDCQGLCAQCGARLEDDPGHHHEVLDPRWSALSGLLEQDTSEKTTDTREER
ncbi:YceD family protein [Kocuria turfanensis]|uniref:YceD family protein n=2 Tax=Kocuria turfanensis TaxID=388357 RepID=UPI000A5134DE|nr:YceD family protein [Kocuria turfanensis]